MLKKILSPILALSLVTSMFPAFAVSSDSISSEPVATVSDAIGNNMSFSIENAASGEYVLKYYENSILKSIYQMDGSRYVDAVSANGEQYVIDTEQFIYQTASNTISPRSVQQPLCEISYKYSSSLSETSTGQVDYISTTNRGTYYVNAYKGSIYSDLVSVVANLVIGAFVSTLIPPSAPVIAASVIGSMLTSVGATVENNIITKAFNKPFDCITTKYSYATSLAGKKHISSGSLNEAGRTELVMYNGIAESDTFYTGYTPTTI